MSTEITFRLPGVRASEITADPHAAMPLTATTPINDDEERCTPDVLLDGTSVSKPVVRRTARRFLAIDLDVGIMQEEGFAYE